MKQCSVVGVPFLLNLASPLISGSILNMEDLKAKEMVNFFSDGLIMNPSEYLKKLQEIDSEKPIERDFYGKRGSTELLEEEFAKVTGKEKAIYLPSGTMANQVAIKLLNGQNTKAIVPENSHIFRDEADAASSVHSLRLVPCGKDKPFFDVNDLKDTIDYLNKGEVFESGLGTIAIECPVRRANGAVVPFETLSEIAEYAIEHNYKMHLDGSRLHLASYYSGVSIEDYSSLFDTVYISLYKCLNAAGGAILCGDEELINRVAHHIKVLGGNISQNWTNTSVAMHYLNDIDERWKKVLSSSKELINELKKLDEIEIESVENGSNISFMKIAKNIDADEFAKSMFQTEKVWLGRPVDGMIRFHINESILKRDPDSLLDSWKNALKSAAK